MEYEKLEKVYTSYCLTYTENMMYSKPNVIYCFEAEEMDEKKEVDMFEMVKNILSELVHVCVGENETQMLNNLKELHDNKAERKDKYNTNIKDFLGNIKIKFGRSIKRKEVFFAEILSHFESFLDRQYFQKLKKESEDLMKSWNSYYRIMMADILRGNTTALETKLEKVLENERKLILRLYETAGSYSVAPKVDSYENIWRLENNKRDEIHFNEKILIIKVKEEHNAWIEDNSIKAILKQTIQEKEKWKMSAHICVSGAYREINYHVGLVFRTSDDKMYFWGCYNEECIRLSNIGIKVDEIDISSEDGITDLDLGVVKENLNVKLYYRTQNSGEKFLDIPILGNTITEVGLCCKTWESEFDKDFVVEFSKINYNILQ